MAWHSMYASMIEHAAMQAITTGFFLKLSFT